MNTQTILQALALGMVDAAARGDVRTVQRLSAAASRPHVVQHMADEFSGDEPPGPEEDPEAQADEDNPEGTPETDIGGFKSLKAWDEDKHPRDHGKFSEKPGASGDKEEYKAARDQRRKEFSAKYQFLKGKLLGHLWDETTFGDSNPNDTDVISHAQHEQLAKENPDKPLSSVEFPDGDGRPLSLQVLESGLWGIMHPDEEARRFKVRLDHTDGDKDIIEWEEFNTKERAEKRAQQWYKIYGPRKKRDTSKSLDTILAHEVSPGSMTLPLGPWQAAELVLRSGSWTDSNGNELPVMRVEAWEQKSIAHVGPWQLDETITHKADWNEARHPRDQTGKFAAATQAMKEAHPYPAEDYEDDRTPGTSSPVLRKQHPELEASFQRQQARAQARNRARIANAVHDLLHKRHKLTPLPEADAPRDKKIHRVKLAIEEAEDADATLDALRIWDKELKHIGKVHQDAPAAIEEATDEAKKQLAAAVANARRHVDALPEDQKRIGEKKLARLISLEAKALDADAAGITTKANTGLVESPTAPAPGYVLDHEGPRGGKYWRPGNNAEKPEAKEPKGEDKQDSKPQLGQLQQAPLKVRGQGFFAKPLKQAAAVLGSPVSDKELASLTGSFGGGNIEAHPTKYDGTHPGISIDVDHPQYTASRIAYKDKDNKLVMHNSSIFLKGETGTGLGIQVFAEQVKTLIEKGFDRIECHAAGAKGKDTNGYITWAKFGYDGPIPESRKAKVAESKYAGAKSVLDICAQEGGPEWWAENGADFMGTFDLKPGSRSREVFKKYLQRKTGQTHDVNTTKSLEELIVGFTRKALVESPESPGEGYVLDHEGPRGGKYWRPGTTENESDKHNDGMKLQDVPLKMHVPRSTTDPQMESRKALGFTLHDKDIAGLAGSTHGGHIHVEQDNFDGNPYLNIRVHHPDYDCTRRILRDDSGALLMQNECFTVNEPGHGLGLQIFTEQLRNLIDFEFDRIECEAAGDKDDNEFNGYITWAKLGFDGPIPGKLERDVAASPYAGAKTVQDIMRQPGGTDWWQEHGSWWDATFDLKPGSKSLEIFGEYLRRKTGKSLETFKDLLAADLIRKRVPPYNESMDNNMKKTVTDPRQHVAGDAKPPEREKYEECDASPEDMAILDDVWKEIAAENAKGKKAEQPKAAS